MWKAPALPQSLRRLSLRQPSQRVDCYAKVLCDDGCTQDAQQGFALNGSGNLIVALLGRWEDFNQDALSVKPPKRVAGTVAARPVSM